MQRIKQILLSSLFIFYPFNSYADRLDKSKFPDFYSNDENNNQFNFDDSQDSAWTVILTGTIPFTFSKLENKEGKWEIGNRLETGVGASIILGKAFFEKNSVEMEYLISIGASLTAGISNGGTGIEPNANIFAGFGPVALSWSPLNKSFGLSTNLNTTKFLNGSFLNLWNEKK